MRRGHQVRLVIPGPTDATHPLRIRDEKLVALVAEAYAARQLVMNGPEQFLASIALATNRCRTRLTKLAGLACLALNIIAAIVEGRQPASLTSRALLVQPVTWVTFQTGQLGDSFRESGGAVCLGALG